MGELFYGWVVSVSLWPVQSSFAGAAENSCSHVCFTFCWGIQKPEYSPRARHTHQEQEGVTRLQSAHCNQSLAFAAICSPNICTLLQAASPIVSRVWTWPKNLFPLFGKESATEILNRHPEEGRKKEVLQGTLEIYLKGANLKSLGPS